MQLFLFLAKFMQNVLQSLHKYTAHDIFHYKQHYYFWCCEIV